jgi:hypothetical protein
MYRSLDHSANIQGHKFSFSDRNAFLISIDTHEGEGPWGLGPPDLYRVKNEVTTIKPFACLASPRLFSATDRLFILM